MNVERDIRPVGGQLFYLPTYTRVPLKFGAETVNFVTCARVRLTIRARDGRLASGWGETPLSVTWVWPSGLDYESRHQALRSFCERLLTQWTEHDAFGHPMEIGADFVDQRLPSLLEEFNDLRRADHLEPMPWLAALVCLSLFDIATHDAYGALHQIDTYKTYNRDWMNRDLADFMSPAENTAVHFRGAHPERFLSAEPRSVIPAWHLVGGADPLDPSELTGSEPDDGYPNTLVDWIQADHLTCLKIKLRGDDADWDERRLAKVGSIAIENGVRWLTADFNCMVTDPSYVNTLLDRLRDDAPRIYGALLYVEQPFPYELSRHPIDVHSVSSRKPLFLDESAHDWREVRRGRELGWNGVALKTCKTQTGALLSLCWARAHGMGLMVQDLTNPMLAQIPHLRLGERAATIMGVETNSMQFYPEASAPEAQVHPGAYRRRAGCVDLSTFQGPGFGYRVDEIARELPEPVLTVGDIADK